MMDHNTYNAYLDRKLAHYNVGWSIIAGKPANRIRGFRKTSRHALLNLG